MADKSHFTSQNPPARVLSEMPSLERAVTQWKQAVGVGPLFMLRCDRTPVMLNPVNDTNLPICQFVAVFSFAAIQFEHPHLGSLTRSTYQARTLQHCVHAFRRMEEGPKMALP